jgi:L-ascorbate metabolism protein UlaG (beta-lactamase superfamily)
VAGSRLAFVGHSTVLVDMAGVRLLTDPVLSGRVAHIRRRVALPDMDGLLELDAILISHAHADHLHPASLRSLAATCPVIAPRGCARILRRAGLREVVELEAGGHCAVGPVRVEAVHAEHDGRRHPFQGQMPALGFLLEGPTRIYFAGDTDLFDGMAELAGRVDVALLPIWGWGRRLPPGHLSPASAARAVALVRPAVAIPIHWGTLRSIGAPHDTASSAPARAFAAEVEAQGLPTTVRILVPGESASFGVESGRPN